MAHRFFEHLDDWRDFLHIVQDVWNGKDVVSVPIKGDTLDGYEGIVELVETIKATPKNTVVHLTLMYMSLGGARGIRKLGEIVDRLYWLFIIDSDFGSIEGIEALCEILEKPNSIIQKLFLLLDHNHRLNFPRFGKVPFQVNGLNLADCSICDSPMPRVGTHVPPIIDLCAKCYCPVRNGFLNPNGPAILRENYHVKNIDEFLETRLLWSAEHTDPAPLGPGKATAKLWRAISRSKIRDAQLIGCNLVGPDSEESFFQMVVHPNLYLKSLTIGACQLKPEDFKKGLHDSRCALERILLTDVTDDLAIIILASNVKAAFLTEINNIDFSKPKVEDIQKCQLERLTLLNMDGDYSGRMNPLISLLPHYPRLHTLRAYNRVFTRSALKPLAAAYVHPSSNLRIIRLVDGPSNYTAQDLHTIARLMRTRHSEWMKIVLLLLNVSIFKSSFPGNPCSALNSELIRMISEYLPLDGKIHSPLVNHPNDTFAEEDSLVVAADE